MYGVLHNQYHQDFMQEAKERDEMYQDTKRNSKFDSKKFFSNRAQQKRVEFNRRKIQIMDEEKAKFMKTHNSRSQKAGKIGNFYPMNHLNKLMTFRQEMAADTQSVSSIAD